MYKSAFLLLSLLFSVNSFAQTIQPDPDFGVGGKVETGYFDTNINPYGRNLGVLPDGSALTFGSVGPKIYALKFHPDGSLDSGYTTKLPILANTKIGSALQSDEKSLVVGTYANKMSIIRLMPGGGLDTTFGDGGVVSNIYNPKFFIQVLVQADGKIVTYGDSYFHNDLRMLVSRWESNGAPDSTFGTQGQAWINAAPGIEFVLDGLVQPDGKLIFAGRAGDRPMLVRLNPDGSRDSSFNYDGVVVDSTSGDGEYYSLRVQPDGKIVTGGYGSNSTLAIVFRYLPNGSRDTTFGNQGVKALANAGIQHECVGLEVLPSGKILVLVSAFLKTKLVKLLENGQLDTLFGNNSLYEYPGGDIRARYMELNGDQLTVSSQTSFDQETVLLRFLLGSNVGLIEPSSAPTMWIYPNPVVSGPMHLSFELKQSAQIEAAIYDMNGRRLQHLSTPQRFDAGTHELAFDLPAQLPAGQYVVSLELDGERRAGVLIVIP